MDLDLSCSLCASADDPRFAAFLAIYEEALPARERKTVAQLAHDLTRPATRLLMLEDADAVIGFALVHVGAGFALLEYMAIRRDRRSAGLGARLFAEATALAGDAPLLIEVDSPRERAARDLSIRLRRIDFYRRCGCRTVRGLDYVLPLPGEGAPPLMDLMAYTAAPKLRTMDLARWLSAIYADVYAQPNDDPRIVAMLAPLGEVAELD